MDIVERHEQGAAVEDVQRRLAQMGYLTEDAIDGIYEEQRRSEDLGEDRR